MIVKTLFYAKTIGSYSVSSLHKTKGFRDHATVGALAGRANRTYSVVAARRKLGLLSTATACAKQEGSRGRLAATDALCLVTDDSQDPFVTWC